MSEASVSSEAAVYVPRVGDRVRVVSIDELNRMGPPDHKVGDTFEIADVRSDYNDGSYFLVDTEGRGTVAVRVELVPGVVDPGPLPGGRKDDSDKLPMHLIAGDVLSAWACGIKNPGIAYINDLTLRDCVIAVERLADWWQRNGEAILGIGINVDSSMQHLLDALTEIVDWRGVAAVLAFGAKKYAPRNWEKGIAYSRVYGAALRHLTAVFEAVDVIAKDDETGLPHVDHAACCIMFLLAYEMRGMRADFDDRPNGGAPMGAPRP